MRALIVAGLLLTTAGALAQTSPTAAAADPQAALEQHVKDLEERIIQLEGQVRMLAQQARAQQPAPVAPAPQVASTPEATAAAAATASPSQTLQGPASAAGEGGASLPVYGGSTAAAKALNPDISVIGDFIGAAGHYPEAPGSVIRQAGFRSLEMHESEVGLQAIIDPYARGDFFICASARKASIWRRDTSRLRRCPPAWSDGWARCGPPSARSTLCTITCCRGWTVPW